MVRHVAAERFVFGAACALVAHKVGPCAADAGGACGFVGIDHYMVFGGFFQDILVVVVGELAVMVLATGNDVAHITGLDGIVSVFVHQVECTVEMTLVV